MGVQIERRVPRPDLPVDGQCFDDQGAVVFIAATGLETVDRKVPALRYRQGAHTGVE
ncbi:hypothetical protein ACQP2C_02190 [Micromonospora zamorensis]|uniref:hypothetical protein n=1 Tax=Micromonospora zamorensis TaxID=709883 RepID=UPI003D99577A